MIEINEQKRKEKKLMIPKKIIFLLTTIFFFTLIPSNANALKDCSHLRAFSHDWNMCKFLGAGPENETNPENDTNTVKKKKGSNIFKKGTNIFSNTLNKIKNLGGETIGGKD